MIPLGDAREHFWLTIGMADTCAADLSAALREGRLGRSEYSGMVNACRDCPDPDACRMFLHETAHADAPPSYCVNRDKLIALAGEQG